MFNTMIDCAFGDKEHARSTAPGAIQRDTAGSLQVVAERTRVCIVCCCYESAHGRYVNVTARAGG